MAVRVRGLVALWAAVVLSGLGSAAWAVEADPIADGSFTIILLPDTQNYSTSYPQIYAAQTQWIADHQVSHNIKMVLHQGDVTNNNSVAEFNNAKAAMSILDTAGVPYSIAPGNHDYTTGRSTLFNSDTYFGTNSAYGTQASIGGFFEAGKTDNSYSTFNAGGRDWLVFSVEFGPRDQVVDWMLDVVEDHPNHYYILNTHAYLYSDSTRYDWWTKGTSQSWNPHNYSTSVFTGGVNDGQELWDKLVKLDDHWRFTFNGHVLNDGAGWLASEGNNGNVVHQILANYQNTAEGGGGYLRIMEFYPDGDTVRVTSYSPYYGSYLQASDQHFTLSMTSLDLLPEPPPTPIRGVSGFRLEVADSTNHWSVMGTGPGTFNVISPDNPADVSVALDGMPLYRDRGVLMASVSQNSRNGYYGTVEVSYTNYFSLDPAILQIATSGAITGGEKNVNGAAAFFSFDDPWMAGHVAGTGTLLEHSNLPAGNVTRTSTGRYRIALPGVDARTDGMLFAIGGENADNVIAAAPTADGTAWELAIRNNKASSFTAFQDKQFAFVFVDFDAPGLIGGRIAANGIPVEMTDGFSLSHSIGTGAYRLSIPGYTPNDGILLLTVAGMETSGGITAPANNFASYEASGNDFVIQLRDLDGLASAQDCGFMFAFLPYDNTLAPARPGDANFDGVVDEQDAAILADHWLKKTGATWWDADFNHDGAVDDLDASILAAHWQYTPGGAAVPEPGTWALLVGLGLAWVLAGRRNRRTHS